MHPAYGIPGRHWKMSWKTLMYMDPASGILGRRWKMSWKTYTLLEEYLEDVNLLFLIK